jgi:hypothetical protein
MRLPRAVLSIIGSLLMQAAFAQAANQASCTFTTFSAPNGYSFAQVNGLSDDGTVVGQLEDLNSGAFVAFSRTSAGKWAIYSEQKSLFTWFDHRNLQGVNVGSYLDNNNLSHVHGIAQSVEGVVEVNYPKATNTWIYGINSSGTVVGQFQKGTANKGFMLASGKYTTIAYPNALVTSPQAINDAGIVAGSFSTDGLVNHGFIWNGSFQIVDYPKSRFGTVLADVNNAGIVVGNHISADKSFGFIYKNKAFFSIVYPNAKYTTVGGINNNGIISGQIFITQSNTMGYTAVCK